MVLLDDINTIIKDNNIDWDKLSDSTVLITGATGLIGSLCVRTLLLLGNAKRIIVCVRDETKARLLFGDSVEYFVTDIRKPFVFDGKIDYIIHCAAVTKSKMMVDYPADTMNISIMGTKNVLDLAIKTNVKSIVYVSSMEAYGITDICQNPITEEKLGYLDLTTARASYPESKRACECLCFAYGHQYDLPVKVIRLAQTFGAGMPLEDNRLSMHIAKCVVNKEDIVLHTEGKSLLNFCYSTDSIRGLFTVLLKGVNGEIYNINNDSEIKSVRETAEMVASRITMNTIKVICECQKSEGFGYAPDAVLKLSSDKAVGLGWSPEINLESAYRRLIEYIREESIPTR